MRALILLFMLYFACSYAIAQTKVCHPLLWPVKSAIHNSSFSIPQDLLAKLQHQSEAFLKMPPNPVKILNSAGKTNINDADLIATREAVKDADRAAILAMTFHLTHNPNYLFKTREILLNWASINHPTGNPINETRLDGMIWAYDLISCDLSRKEQVNILNWFERMRMKKVHWKFGKITTNNNHRIHQLKMLLLLDKILQHPDWENNIAVAEKYSSINLNPRSGMSLDYIERNALYYHNYVMQPWLEISLITGCCRQPVEQGFAFLSHKILSHNIQHEFLHSQAKIDSLRAKGGFFYAKTNGAFDNKKTAPSILMYYTLVSTHPEPQLWSIQEHTKPSPKILFLKVRRLLWLP